MIALPPHDPCGIDGCGDVAPDMSARCSTRRTFRAARMVDGKFEHPPVDAPGCGKVPRLDDRTGIRGWTS